MSEWITDRRPTEDDACKDAESVLYECVIVPGRDYKLYRKWYNVTSGEAWQCIPWENADELIAKAKNADDLSYTDFPTCPYCGDVDVDAWELDFDGDEPIETDCGACDGTYIVERHVTVEYSTRIYEEKKP